MQKYFEKYFPNKNTLLKKILLKFFKKYIKFIEYFLNNFIMKQDELTWTICSVQNDSYELAIKLLSQNYNTSISRKKDFLAHMHRVGVILWELDYSKEIQIAWLLHDILEDTNLTEDNLKIELEKIFRLSNDNFDTENIVKIIKANTKNIELKGKSNEEYGSYWIFFDCIENCAKYNKEALIIKCADIFDNFRFNLKTWDKKELQRLQKMAIKAIELSKNFDNSPIFEKLEKEVINYKIS